jgi:ADP-heptose:LPS heptosyltransferase
MSVAVKGQLNLRKFDRIVVFFANALGDHLLALPTLRALSAALDGRFTLATADSPTDLLLGDVQCERVVKIPISWLDGKFDAAETASLLGPMDLFVSLNYWHNASVDAFVDHLTSTVTVGFDPHFEYEIVADTSRHHIDQVFQVCDVLGIRDTPERHAYPIPLPAASLQFAGDIRKMLGGRKLFVVHAESKPDKTWPLAQVNEAIEAFLDTHEDFVPIVLSRRAERLAGLTPRAVPLGGAPLASATAVVAAADVFLGVDSFHLHVADLWRRPGLGLFGPTQSRHWGFRFSPFGRHVDGGSMTAIDVDDVASRLAHLVKEAQSYESPNLIGNAVAPVVTLRYS